VTSDDGNGDTAALPSPSEPLSLYMVGVIVEEMGRAVEFYRRLGLEIADGSEELAHVEIPMPPLTFFLNTKRSNARWDPARTDPTGGYRIVLEFYLGGEQDVDRKHAEMIGFGYGSHAEPYDVSDEMRFALIDDPDGNTILLSGQKEPRSS
jgi:hypothetical protein